MDASSHRGVRGVRGDTRGIWSGSRWMMSMSSVVMVACAGTDGDPQVVSPGASVSPSTTATTSNADGSATSSQTSSSSGTSSSTAVQTSSAAASSSTHSTSSNTASTTETSGTTSSEVVGVSFSADIHPILTAKCSGDSCHSGTFFDKYAVEDVTVAYGAASVESDKIVMRTGNGTMPLGRQCLEGNTWSTDALCLTEAERMLLQEWAAAGAPQ